MKPVNLRFYRRSLYMAMLDCDGFSIQGENERFEAPQFTPDYLAPEFHVNGITVEGEEQQDRFALAVVIFQLLNFGIHPFTGRPNSEHMPTDIPGRIRTRNYAYGLRPSNAISPSIISGHETISKQLRYLFDRAFESPGNTRPSAGEWASTLKRYAQKSSGSLLVCQKNNEHQFFSGHTCAACNRENILKKARQMASSKPAAPVISPLGKPRAWQRAAALAKKLPPVTPRKPKTSRPAFTKLPSYIQAQANAGIKRSSAHAYRTQSPIPSTGAPSWINNIPAKYLYIVPIVIIFVLFSAIVKMSPSSTDFSENNQRRMESDQFQKDLRSLELQAAHEFDAAHPRGSTPDLQTTSVSIRRAAESIASGKNVALEEAFASLMEAASKRPETSHVSIERYRQANTKFLNLDGQGFADRQARLESDLREILSRDPLFAEAALDLGWYRISQVEQEETWFQQVILAKPQIASAWYGLGIQMLDIESDDTIVGIFAVAEMLYGNTVADQDSRNRADAVVRTLPSEKQKRFAILKIRAQQLAAEMLSKGVAIRTPDATAESTVTNE